MLPSLSRAGLFLFLLISCGKPSSFLPGASALTGRQSMQANSRNLLIPLDTNYTPSAGSDHDTVETSTILGQQLTNPYSLDNMTDAYNIVHSTQVNRLPPTNLYVRFLPSDIDQLAVLADSLDLDLFDRPMDYSVVQDGDYYQDPSIPMEQITWQYAVVQPGFQFPAGITHQVLDSIYIPGNDDYAVEDMAFQLAGDPEIDEPGGAWATATPYSVPLSTVVTPQVVQCPPGYVWSWTKMKCLPVPIYCPPGEHWDSDIGGCVVDNPLPPIQPPGPGSHYPAGHLRVFDTQLSDAMDPESGEPLRHVRVVAKRWFKIQRLYTDDNGYFESTKRFRKKVKIIVKFKNDYAKIKGVRGFRLWNIFYAVEKNLGTYKGALNDITYVFRSNNDIDSKGNRCWVAATAHNDVQEYRDLASAQGIGMPPKHLKILLSNWGAVPGASTPMYAKRTVSDLPEAFLKTFVITAASQVAGGINALAGILKRRVDIYYSYKVPDIADLQSDRIAETIFHEMTHSAHYAKVGNAWWGALVNAEINEIVANFGTDFSPYGHGNSPLASPIIALTESWAYYMGHFMADQEYGNNSSTQVEQNELYLNNSPVAGLSSHLNLLEDFSPYRTNDPFHWIPQGLFYDMMDDRNDFNAVPRRVALMDNVTGYTNQEFFNALDIDIYDLGDYRQRLLQENGNDQATGVNVIFNFYGY